MLLCHCISFFPLTMINHPGKNNLREEGILRQLQILVPRSGEAERADMPHHIYRQEK